MAATEAQKRAKKKYDLEKNDHILVRVPKGKLDIIKEHAASSGESVNRFINRSINETIDRDNNTPAD